MGVTALRAPTPDIANHQVLLTQLKEETEVGRRIRGNPDDSFVTLGELISAGILKYIGKTVSPGSKGGGLSTVNVLNSITGDGSVGTPLKLVGDVTTPGASQYYGTNAGSVRGWYNLPAGGSSPLTTKGDLFGYSTVNARVPVGSDGKVLTADSTAATGVSWQTPAGGGSSPFNVTPDTHGSGVPAFVANDEFEGGALDTAGTRFTGATPWITVNWSALGGTTTAPLQLGAMQFTSEPNASGTRDPALVVQAVAGGSAWTYAMKLNIDFQGGGGNLGAVVLYEQSTGKTLEFGVFNGNNSAFFSRVIPGTIATVGSVGTNPFVQDGYTGQYNSKYIRVQLNSGNLIFTISLDGLTFRPLNITGTYAVASFFTTAPSHIGYLVESVSSSVQTILNTDWFRRTA